MQITKATRYQIVKPLDADWNEFGQVLRDLSYWTTKMANAAIQMYWEHHHFRLRWKEEKGAYPDAKVEQEMYGCTFRNHVYRRLREMNPEMASLNTSQTNQFAMNRWKNDVADVMRLRKSIPSFRLGAPVQVANQNYRLFVVEGEKPEYRVAVTLLGKESPQSRFLLLLDAGDGSKKAIFRRIVDGTYKQGTIQIVKNEKKKKWFCVVSYTFTPDKLEGIDENTTMGVVLGVGNSAAYWTFNRGDKRAEIPLSEIEAAEAKIKAIAARRRNIQQATGSGGHGRKRRLAATEKDRGRASDIRDAIAHKYSRKLVDIAIANRCGKIVIGVPDNSSTKAFSWASLVQMIVYKAQEKGIAVVEAASVTEAFCTCSACSYSNPENVEGNMEFITCKECGARLSMAYNTAKNLAVSEKFTAGKEKKKAK